MSIYSSARSHIIRFREPDSFGVQNRRPAAQLSQPTIEPVGARTLAAHVGRSSRRRRGRVAVSVIAVVLIATLASCNDSEPDPVPTPTKSASTTPTSTKAAWESKYHAKEIAAYKEALARYQAYQREVRPIWAAGKATPSAKKLFQEYFIPWQFYYKQLEQYEATNIKLDLRYEVLDSRATRVKLGSDGGSVSIRQCVDQTKSSGTQDGKPLPKSADTPQLIDVVMDQVEGRWLISQISNSQKDRPCDAGR